MNPTHTQMVIHITQPTVSITLEAAEQEVKKLPGVVSVKTLCTQPVYWAVKYDSKALSRWDILNSIQAMGGRCQPLGW